MGGGRTGELERHRGGVRAQRVKALRLAVVLLVIATTSAHGEIRRIRVCADPSNLPFSSQRTDEPGFELEIARAIAGGSAPSSACTGFRPAGKCPRHASSTPARSVS